MSLNKTTAYRVFTDNYKEIAQLYDSAGPFAAGSIYSTTSDLFKYYKSFESQQVLKKEFQEIAFSPSPTNSQYGHGWQLNGDMVYHGGGAAGFRSNLAMIPEEGICVIILNNHENSNPEYLTRCIVDILHSKEVELPLETKLAPESLGRLVGAFQVDNPRLLIYTSVVDGRLAVEVSGQGKSTVIAKDAFTFLQPEADATLRFKANGDSVYQMIVDHGFFNKLVARRIASSWGILGDATQRDGMTIYLT